MPVCNLLVTDGAVLQLICSPGPYSIPLRAPYPVRVKVGHLIHNSKQKYAKFNGEYVFTCILCIYCAYK